MLKNTNKQTIFAIAFCGICKEYTVFINEITFRLDAERKISIHAGIKHNYNKKDMGWTNIEPEMAEIREKPGFKEGYL